MSKDEKLCQINIYRKDSDTPIILYDKTELTDEEILSHLETVFSSPKISVISTSSETLIIKPSQIDAIGVINNIDLKRRKKLIKKDSKADSLKKVTEPVTDLVTIEVADNTDIKDDNEIEQIDIGTINGEINDD